MESSPRRIRGAAASVLNPRSWVHVLRLLHYYHYSHVGQIRRINRGLDVKLAPNVSLSNADRITIGDRTNIGARCHLWAGGSDGTITIGRDVRFAPNCFLTAANYGTHAGVPFLQQPQEENGITIGNEVWLGAGVIVLPGVSIGDGAIIAAGAVVAADIPENVIAGGVPARVLRQR